MKIYGGISETKTGEISEINKDDFTLTLVKGKNTYYVDLVNMFEKAKEEFVKLDEGDSLTVVFKLEKNNEE